MKITQAYFNVLERTLKRSNVLFDKEYPHLMFMPYEFVKIQIPQLLEQGLFTEIIKAYCPETTQEQLQQLTIQKLLPFIFNVKDELEEIYKLEQERLTFEPDTALVHAGINELNILGEVCIIDNLAGGDILKWEQVRKLPYHQVFDKLYKNNIEARIQKKLQKAMASKRE